MNTQQQQIDLVIVGLGTTGLSVARYLSNQKQHFAVVDSRETPPGADDLKSNYADIPCHFGDFNVPWMSGAKQLIVNPGITVATDEIKLAKDYGVEIIGDIELFARHLGSAKPVIAITGSNGKTTVTSLLDLMAKKSGLKVETGGNIGKAALDLLSDDDAELFILELSSYQLETSPSLQTLAAVILNVSEDHLDRYNNNLEEYAQAKAAIYNNCKHIVFNRDDIHSSRFAIETADADNEQILVSFGFDKPKAGQFGVLSLDGVDWLAKGEECLMPISEIRLPGAHNVANSLAALALGDITGLNFSAMLDALREYVGMPHRTQWLTNLNGVNWYNDSKGTNVGATLAALSGLPGKTVLIAGGQGKGADFSPLGKMAKEKARAVILLGEDANKIAKAIDNSVDIIFVKTMSEAVKKAYEIAKGEVKDNVLLSPACASFDMFKNYIVRGEVFMDEVIQLEQKVKEGEGNV